MTTSIFTNRIKQVSNDLADAGIEFDVWAGNIILPNKLFIQELFDFLKEYNKGIVIIDLYTQEIRMTFPE